MYKYFLILLLLAPAAFPQPNTVKFFDALINDKSDINKFVNKDELAKSERFGITYTGVKNKLLLGYELPEEVKSGIISGRYKYEVAEMPLEGGYVQVIFRSADANFSRIYYFNEGFVTNSAFITSDWQKKDSKYFRFSIEEPKYFNEYCIKRLDDFVDMIADTLHFTISERRILEKEKIGYIFCKDENTVEKITGFKAKGMAMLGSDEVVTSYQTHFHEVAHILINYKLKKLGLYTLPFFMEGFAVAVGGRGGMAPRVVTDLGYYLQKSGILTYDSILTNDGFYNNDASMSYAVAGLYNSFLLNELGVEKYLEIYKKVNGDLEFVKNIVSTQINLGPGSAFQDYLEHYNDEKLMYVDEKDTTKLWIKNFGSNGEFALTEEYIKFFSHSVYSIGFDEIKTDNEYVSRKYSELCNDEYRYMKYCILTSNESVSIYNLFNDELIFSYIKSLSLNNFIIPQKDGFYEFFIKSSLFNQDFTSKIIIMDGTFR